MALKVNNNHSHALGYCAKGVRAFLAGHGIDWLTFVREGIDEEVLLATGDQMALNVVEQARKEAVDGRRG